MRLPYSFHSFIFNNFIKRNKPDQTESELIKNYINKGNPAMIARFGATEIKGVIYGSLPKILRKKLFSNIFEDLKNYSGVFNLNESNINLFRKLMLKDIDELDVLASWRIEEILFKKKLKNTKKISLSSLDPFKVSNPWSSALKNKRVLVIHPFEDTIRNQFQKRKLLFENQDILPDLELITLKAIQSQNGSIDFENWFEALNYMKDRINSLKFDVAIIGAGGYGFCLASHIKRMGRISIHMGGSTQLLFGIYGKRWDKDPIVSKLKNKHWVFPSEEDMPENVKKTYSKIEDGGYWNL